MIDEEHKKLIGLLNKVIAKEHNDNPEELREVLREMTNYALTHFKTEETYMIDFNYSEYIYHKIEHLDFEKKTISYYERVADGDYQITNEIHEYLEQWLDNHIQVTDKKYISCFKKNGL
jgi:hemerythrin-like metal-binding protein